MFGLRSARSRAVLAGFVLVLVLAAVATVAILRVRQHQDRLLALESTATSVAALEHARAQFFLETTAVSTLIYTQDPVLAERYQAAAAELRQDLSQARAEMIASGKTDDLATLDRLTEQIDALESVIDGAMPILLAGDQDTVLALANTTYLQLWTSIDGAMNDLEALADAEQSELAAARVEANRAADVTNWIVVGFGGAAFLVAAGTLAMLMVSVVRPLASLRASARAITSGDLKARAKVSGPEEVASLARGFNEMTDALSAKTQEYIDTTNLTGDIIVKLDRNGRWTFLNDAACQFFGKPREELLGTDSRASLHPVSYTHLTLPTSDLV